MGLSSSKRVEKSLSNSPEFNSSCDSAFSHCLSLTQHSFNAVFPYQLKSASDHLHSLLLPQLPLIHTWLPTPPDRTRVDSALRVVTRQTTNDETLIGNTLFREWALRLYTDAVVSAASKAVILRVPVGVAGIAGIGAVSRAGGHVVGTAIGVYSLGVVVSIFLGLSG
ncbi:hypothetical protein TanjilG_04452 [Lupinus angustifolius]|uniref:Uncharacterized protein n=1 Tax=Lupinus angustifolius TaxID=3871 RepID=A0A4P1RQ33_LUPAN|nr:PREDICTED: uncharacterized protein LOC109342921 [Lupinus angustifolius]OIW15917.1 hypothetical protein TanjilG_04452 [Lupinus angustifolius]